MAAMHGRYAGTWYRTLTFVQKTSRLLPNGSWSTQTWYESALLPGQLRIDFDPIGAGNGVLYARDSLYVVSNGHVVRRTAEVNPLLLLGFDVYGADPARTAAVLRAQRFDLARVHADSFQGRAMIVVGAERGDLDSRQFWIDAERLYLVRLLEPSARDSAQRQDIRFVNYRRLGGGWIAPRVEILQDGKLVFQEDYSDIRGDLPLDASLFDPLRWKSAPHWAR